MKTQKATWFEIYVDDMDRSVKFYETVFDTKLEPLEDSSDQNIIMVSFPGDMETYGSAGALIKMEGFSAGGNSTLIYFHSEDCITEESRVISAGGKIVKPKMSIGKNGFISLCLDTEGNMFGLHSMR
ncbi:VOC family protein [Candidatus Dojkabacteria bacterium]|uniref:VOC family protein n=1 Tax=Candidatus Dojkabacteria bacterium TaxID=2099670 RepID=A0A955RKS4_9BACT|nr:VOC family protein [Candidatus Dojkabacteria bacterium]